MQQPRKHNKMMVRENRPAPVSPGPGPGSTLICCGPERPRVGPGSSPGTRDGDVARHASTSMPPSPGLTGGSMQQHNTVWFGMRIQNPRIPGPRPGVHSHLLRPAAPASRPRIKSGDTGWRCRQTRVHLYAAIPRFNRGIHAAAQHCVVRKADPKPPCPRAPTRGPLSSAAARSARE